MPKRPLIGAARRNPASRNSVPARMLNCYREPTGEIEPPFLIKSVLGEEEFSNTGLGLMYDAIEMGGKAYLINAGKLIEVDSTGTSTQLGDVHAGEGILSKNNGKITAASKGEYYVWDGTLSTPAVPAFPWVGSVDFIGQYTVVSERNGRRFSWSAVADPKSFDALDFATKEAKDGDTLQVKEVNGRLLLMGEESIEVWYLTGLSGADAFKRLPGVVLGVGLKAKGLVASIPNAAFFIGSDGKIYRTDGAALSPISTPAQEAAIRLGEPTSCYYFEDDGHGMCCIGMKGAPALVYDISTGEWHERSQGIDFGEWPVVATVKLNGEWLAAANSGKIVKLKRNGVDCDQALLRRFVSSELDLGASRARLALLELYANVGEQTSEGTAMLRVSRDGGLTWGATKTRSLGDLGEYATRAVWRSLGLFRKITLEVTIADPGEIAVGGLAEMEIR